MVQNYNKLYYSNNDYIAYSQNNQTTNNRLGVVFLPGFKSDMQGTKALALQEFCLNKNIPYTRFDYQGHGNSSGKFEEGTIGLWLENCLSVIDKLTNGPQLLVGSSMGGWLMLLAALKRPNRIKALLGIAAAPDFTENLIWQNLSQEEKENFIKTNHFKFPAAYEEEYSINYQFIEEARNHLLLNNKIAIDCSIYLFHGMEDKEVPYNISLKIAEKVVSKEVEVHLIKNATHHFSEPKNLALIFTTIEKIISSTCPN